MGLVHIYCGDGKGKTTAAMGLAVRMAGRGGKVLVGQFFKDGSSGEIGMLRQLPGIETVHCDTIPGRFVRLNDDQRQIVRRDYTAYLEMLLEKAKDKDLLILDEVISACNHGTVPENTVADFLRTKPAGLEVVLTGRNPSPALCDLADYVTEMVKRKHPFDDGIPAREGIEY